MTSNKQLTLALSIIVCLSFSVYAQTAGPKTNHFSTDGISFDYPAGYSVSDESNAEAQRFIITRRGSSVRLTIVAPRRLVLPADMPEAAEDLTEPMVKTVALTLGRANAPVHPIETSVGGNQAEGVRLQSLGNRKRTGEVIWVRMSSRLVAMTFVRADVHEAVESELWQTVRSSLEVEAPVIIGTRTVAGMSTKGALTGGVLNGKALALPKPEYPDLARAAHASGTVVVQVLIDEEGNVVSARAVSGHPLLQAASVAAARGAKFLPTKLSGQPVKVTGVIQYNFIAR